MSGRWALDTNAVIALFGGDPDVEAKLAEATEVFLPSTVLGELYFGAARSSRPGENSARIDDFAAACTPVGIDVETARLYGSLKAELWKKGRPIPENDVWIAACAKQNDLTLVSRDQHFGEIDDLRIEAW